MKLTAVDKVKLAHRKDPEIICARGDADKTLGSNPAYLEDVFNITKSDLIRLERLGFAMKARYQTEEGPHRTRWLIFMEVL